MATTRCGISHKIVQTNAATTKPDQHRIKISKPQTNTFSKYYEDNTERRRL